MSAESQRSAEAVEARKKPRVCHVVKREDFDGYGFNLHAEKGKPGQYIGKVDENSPAEMAGLRQGDRIIEVNDVNIGTETHKQVVQRIKANPNEVKLLVVDPEVIEVTKDNQIVTGNESNNSDAKEESVEKQEVAVVEEEEVKAPEEHKNHEPASPPAAVKTPPVINNSPEAKKSTTNGTTPKADNASVSSGGSASSRESGGLNLQMTAAELRAKLAARKKYDPKSETVDIKKKFDIIQKL
ncbi:Na(+)/H(+) exchange regulatory cofactor NHE-RF1 [Phlebotomus argentipes]|uniref:Na(+)/H(+) exchange regulatory cofactor NHE-RF1 n=1 Tax=Phlebotomus argentipes TaxID=94469 RepID=UPI0028932E14|nr:Na(+)/H(+) exchange regulatory cofactor NHE-RF1 [Phlebotomus argentipes]